MIKLKFLEHRYSSSFLFPRNLKRSFLSIISSRRVCFCFCGRGCLWEGIQECVCAGAHVLMYVCTCAGQDNLACLLPGALCFVFETESFTGLEPSNRLSRLITELQGFPCLCFLIAEKPSTCHCAQLLQSAGDRTQVLGLARQVEQLSHLKPGLFLSPLC